MALGLTQRLLTASAAGVMVTPKVVFAPE
jgi:hypothetical protein